MAPVSVRLEPDQKEKIKRIAKSKRVKEAVVIRWAIDAYPDDSLFLESCPINSQKYEEKTDSPTA
jgi:hypothetical protein